MSLILWTSEMAQIPLRMWSEFSLSDFSTRFGWGYQNKNSQMNFWAESETKRSGSLYVCRSWEFTLTSTLAKQGGFHHILICKFFTEKEKSKANLAALSIFLKAIIDWVSRNWVINLVSTWVSNRVSTWVSSWVGK